MPFISQKTIDEVQNRLDAVHIVGEYVRLENKGGKYWGLCPFHNEKTASFSVNPDKKQYYCFGCHEGGGIVNFVMAMEKISFPEALTLLAKKTGVEIEYDNYGTASLSKEEEKSAKKKEELFELYRRVAGSFHYILMESEEGKFAKDYILERGINEDMLNTFRVGYAPSNRYWLYKFLQKKGYSEDFLAESSLFSKKYKSLSFFTDRLIFPINDRQGRSVAFGGRILTGDGPKYINSSESLIYKKRDTLFALDLAIKEIRATKELVLCEGYMDTIALHQAGIVNAVAPLGTAFTDEQAKLVRRWADRIKLVFDSDAAGQTAAVKGILTCRKNALSCSVVIPAVKNGKESVQIKDPADILKTYGSAVLLKSLESGIMDEDYLITKSKAEFLNNPSDSRGTSKAIASLVPFFESIDSEVDREAFYKKVADSFGLEPKTVLNELSNEKAVVKSPNTGKESGRTVTMNDELFLLSSVAVNCDRFPDLFNKLRMSLPKEEFDNQDAKDIYIALEESFRAGDLHIDAILSKITDEALRVFVTQKSAGDEFSNAPEKLVIDGIRGVKKKRLESKRQKLVTEIRLAKNDGEDLSKLLNEKVFVDTELEELKGVI
jgi:DNA primase